MLYNRRFARNAVNLVSKIAVNGSNYGAIAQLGERLHGMQEVSGSIPLTSTIHKVGEPVARLSSVSDN